MKAFNNIPPAIETRMVTEEEISILKKEYQKERKILQQKYLCFLEDVEIDTRDYHLGAADSLKRALKTLQLLEKAPRGQQSSKGADTKIIK